MNYRSLIIAAANLWDPGHIQPFEDVIAEVNLGRLHFGDASGAQTRLREKEYARGQVEIIRELGDAVLPDGWPEDADEGKRTVALDILRELEARVPKPDLVDQLRARLKEYDDTIGTPGQAKDIADTDLFDDVLRMVTE